MATNRTDLNFATGRSMLGEKIAAKLEQSKEFVSLMHDLLEADETKAKGPVAVLRMMQKVLGDEIMKSLPRPMSDSGNNPDKYEMDNPRDPNGKKLKSRVMADIWRGLPEARQLAFVRQQCQWALSADDAGKAEPLYRSLGNPELRDRLNKATNALNNGQAKIDNAVNLLFRIDDISGYSGVELTVLRDNPEDETSPVKDTVYPFTIWKLDGKGKRSDKFQQLSAQQLIRIDVQKALKEGGGFDHLFPARKPKAGQGKANVAVDTVEVKSDTFIPGVANFLGYLTGNNGDNIATLGKVLATADDHTILTLGDFGLVWETQIMPKVQSRYDLLKKKQRDEVEAEAEKKLQEKAKENASAPAPAPEEAPLPIKLGNKRK